MLRVQHLEKKIGNQKKRLSEQDRKIDTLTAERDELQKIVNGPTEDYAIAQDMSEGWSWSTLTLDDLHKAAESFNDMDSVLHTTVVTMTPGMWSYIGSVFQPKVDRLTAQLAREQQDNLRLRDALGSLLEAVEIESDCLRYEVITGTSKVSARQRFGMLNVCTRHSKTALAASGKGGE